MFHLNLLEQVMLLFYIPKTPFSEITWDRTAVMKINTVVI
jgi:hypothetical protein